MKNSDFRHHPSLRLVFDISASAGRIEQPIDAEKEWLARELRAEAIAIEAWYGANAYSRYLIKHGARPDRLAAETIGRMMGTQVKASDGSMQPSLPRSARKAARRAKSFRKAEMVRQENAERAAFAIQALSLNEQEPEEVAIYAKEWLDDSRISTRINGVLGWLNRFAEELTSRGKKTHRIAKPA